MEGSSNVAVVGTAGNILFQHGSMLQWMANRKLEPETLDLSERLLKKAQELEPNARSSTALEWFYKIKSMLLASEARANFVDGRYEEARDAAQRSVELGTNDDFLAAGYLVLAASLAQLDRIREAESALAEAHKLKPELTLAVAAQTLGPAGEDDRDRYLEGLRLAGLED